MLSTTTVGRWLTAALLIGALDAAHARQIAARGADFRACAERLASDHSARLRNTRADEVGDALADLRDRVAEVDSATTPVETDHTRAFLSEVDANLRDVGLAPGQLAVVPMESPGAVRGGVRGALARLRALLPSRRARRKGAGATESADAESADAAALPVAPSLLPPSVAVPLVTGQLGLVAAVAAYRRTFAKCVSRSREFIGDATKERSLLGKLFVLKYHVTARWPDALDGARREGTGGMLAAGLPPGWREFVAAHGATAATQTIFFYLTFVRGIYRWEAMAADDPVASAANRRTAAVLTPLVFGLSGPLLGWAVASTEVLAQIGPVALHPGQVTMAGMAMAAGVLSRSPRLFDYAVPIVERLVYQPIGHVRRVWRTFASQFGTVPPVRTANVDK